MSSDLRRSGKQVLEKELEKICAERSYGKTYSNHHAEEFVKTTNEKPLIFLKEPRHDEILSTISENLALKDPNTRKRMFFSTLFE
jgi:hypothetical protein